jgi:hypothetical protein
MKKIRRRVVVIDSCGDCPHNIKYGRECECAEMSRRLKPYYKDGFPSWCPLRENDDDND